MSKKVVFPLIAVFTLGLAGGALGCRAEAKIGNAEPKAATPPPPPPEPTPPPEPKPAPVEPKAIKAIGKAKIENNEIKIPGKVHFDFDKSNIKEDTETKEILKTVADVLKENPQITKLRVEGHTDDKGGSDHNHKLSQARAEAVAEWLAKNGVDKTRVAVVGFGEDHPLEKNDSDAHREANRRTEFKIWELDGKPTDAAQKEAANPTPAIAPAAGKDGATGTATKPATGTAPKKDAPKK